LLPGLDGTGRLFRPLQEALDPALRCRVISYPPDQELELAQLASLVLRNLPANDTVLLAESFSGLVALTLLPKLQGRLAALVFVGGFAEPPQPHLLRLWSLLPRSGRLMQLAPAFLIRRYCLGRDTDTTDLRRVRDALSEVSPAVLSQRMRLIAKTHAFATSNTGVPCYYIRATEDRLVPASAMQWFKQHFNHLHVDNIEGPHFLLQTKPRECARVIERIMGPLIREE